MEVNLIEHYAYRIIEVIFSSNPGCEDMSEHVLWQATGLTFEQFEAGMRWMEERGAVERIQDEDRPPC